jgi:hypothetical protein
MSLQLQIGLLMLHQGRWSADASLLALLCHRPKMSNLVFDPSLRLHALILLILLVYIIDILAGESAMSPQWFSHEST